MTRGFYVLMAAQFFSSLADNALLIAAIALLRDISAPEWMTPMLKFFFFVSYVVLAAFVGAFADSLPKARVMLITNTIKIGGCMMMFFGVHPLIAYAVVGFGAAAYSPAKYGIVTEMLPPEQLVKANGWIEGLTVGSIILGFVIGGLLVSAKIGGALLAIDMPYVDTGVDKIGEAAIAVIAIFYAIAAAINLLIPDTGARYAHQALSMRRLFVEFAHCVGTLWRDKLGQISLAVTTLFWGAGATLQYIVLKWSEQVLDMNLTTGALLQAVVAIGIAIGAVIAAAKVGLKQSLRVLPVGIIMGCMVASLAFLDFHSMPTGGVGIPGMPNVGWPALVAAAMMIVIGALGGFFVVPMNALLQHRGHVLLSAGHSIAVQNFNENLSILVMLGIYAILVEINLPIETIILLFGTFVAITMTLVFLKHRHNQKQFDSEALIGQARH